MNNDRKIKVTKQTKHQWSDVQHRVETIIVVGDSKVNAIKGSAHYVIKSERIRTPSNIRRD